MNNSYESVAGDTLLELSKHTREVIFSFQLSLNKLIYLNDAFDRVWNMSKEIIYSDFSVLLNTIHPEDLQHLTEAWNTIPLGYIAVIDHSVALQADHP